MGSSMKPEKRLKKTQKRRRAELASNDEGAENAAPSEYDNKNAATDEIVEDVAEVEFTTNKSKNARKDKSKDTLATNKLHKLVQKGVGVKPDLEGCSKGGKGKTKKAHKKRKDRPSSNEESKSPQEVGEVAMQDVYQISSGEDDCSKGMKKWIKEYHERRPGLEVLQQRIDDFLTAYEDQEEQARREKEAKMGEDGWTVVVHHKGGKKTTDSESGVAVGSVAEAAVREKMAKKKSKDVGLDFYRFQRKEAKRNEIMQLQSKFEEDKKRMLQLRAARKFRPY